MLNPDAPLVSVLTPSFNQAAWLPDNLRSVTCQTYANIEHIVIDGGSTDGSLEVLQAAGDSVIWRSEPDEGQSDAIDKVPRESKAHPLRRGGVRHPRRHEGRVVAPSASDTTQRLARPVQVAQGHRWQSMARRCIEDQKRHLVSSLARSVLCRGFE